MSRILSLLSKGITTKGGRQALGGATGGLIDLGIAGTTIGGAIGGVTTAVSLPQTWVKEAAADLDVGDDISGAYNSLPWYKKLAISEGEIESKVKSSEMREFKKGDVFTGAQAYLDPEEMPDLSDVENKGQARAVIGKAVRDVKRSRKRQEDEDDFLSPANRYLMEIAERSRRDAINERADARTQQLEMRRMEYDREDRRDRRDARMQMVAALTNSLGGLGDAFLSI